MLSQRKDEKDLCRETTLYNMCDNMLYDLEKIQEGIMVVNSNGAQPSQQESTADVSHNASLAKIDKSF